MSVELEHANVTVSDPAATAKWMAAVFGWKIRWQGAAKDGGTTFHVGTDSSYVALFRPKTSAQKDKSSNYSTLGGLNHLAVVVTDLDAIEAKVLSAGFKTENHGDYEPGRRFYFHDADDIEFEVVSYTG